MTKSCFPVSALLFAVLIAAGCNGKAPENNAPDETPPMAPTPAPTAFTGQVTETTNANRYTYVKVEAAGTTIWAAANVFEVKVGDRVTVPTAMPMKGFVSKALNRTFDVIYFASAITVHGAQTNPVQMPPSHPKMPPSHAKMPPNHPKMPAGGGHPVPTATTVGRTNAIDFSGITKPEGGITVAEVYAEKTDLAGKKVLMRAKVVKVNANIMGKNWVHLQDGTGGKGSNDLTAVTLDMTLVGETVIASGVLATNRDFGFGYKYPIILDEAEIKLEAAAKPKADAPPEAEVKAE